MTSQFLKSIVKDLPSEYVELASEGLDADVRDFVDTGSYSFNALLSGSIYGGFPGNRISVICGENSSGKTFYALEAVKNFLAAYEGSIAIYFDTESAVTTQMLETRGIDPARVAVVGVATLEEFRHNAVALLDGYIKESESTRPRMIIVLDSFGMLSSEKEMADTTDGKSTVDMTKGRIAKAIFRVLTLKLAKANVPMIVNVHQYLQQGVMFPQAVPAGGEGLKYACSSLVFVSKSKVKDGMDVVGALIKCKMGKSRITIENKIVGTRLFYDRGLDRYFGLLEIAEKHGIVEKTSKQWKFPGMPPSYENAIYKNPEKFFTPEILQRIDDACKEEFHYMSGTNNQIDGEAEYVEDDGDDRDIE